jgi:hypothetical protein
LGIENSAIKMSHAEIWDDSALVDSWNEALQEYKVPSLLSARFIYLADSQQKYHSISARGERVEDVLKASQEQLTEKSINPSFRWVKTLTMIQWRREGL